jgi:hypothetical protein
MKRPRGGKFSCKSFPFKRHLQGNESDYPS